MLFGRTAAKNSISPEYYCYPNILGKNLSKTADFPRDFDGIKALIPEENREYCRNVNNNLNFVNTPRTRSQAKETSVSVKVQTPYKKEVVQQAKMAPNKKNHSAALGSHYVIGCKLGSGSFGTIYHCRNENKRKDYAIKMESNDDNDGSSQLAQEAKILLLLENHVGFCKFAYCDFEYSHFPDKNLLVMDLLGPTLEDLLNLCNRVFTLKTICLFAEQALNRIEVLHSKNYIHRDIKPENFLIGSNRTNQRTIFLADFGLCKKYRDPKTLQHIPYRDGRSLSGTARYASVNAQSGIEQSRRDDLEGLFYTFIYLYKGELPWQGIQAPNKAEKHKRMLKQKKSMSIGELCVNCPPEFSKYIMYVRKLKFEEGPDYEYLRNLFRNMLRTWYTKSAMQEYVQMSAQEVKSLGKNYPHAMGTITPVDGDSETNRYLDRDEDDDGTYIGNRDNLSLADQLKRNTSGRSSASNGTVSTAHSGYQVHPHENTSFIKLKDNLRDPLFDWEKQRTFYPKMKCSGMPELSEDADSQRERAKEFKENKSNTKDQKDRSPRTAGNGAYTPPTGVSGKSGNQAYNPPYGMPHYNSNGVARYDSDLRNNNNNVNNTSNNKVSDISNPKTIPGNPVCVERMKGATNSRKNVTPRQSSNIPEMSKNSTAKFGRDDDRVAGRDKKGGPLTRFIGFCNKKNPPTNTYTPR